jgi:beta-lactamase class A
VGVASDSNATAAGVLHYSLGQRLVPLSLVFHGDSTSRKQVNAATLHKGLQTFAEARAQDPTNASVVKAAGVYTGIKPGKPGYVVDTGRLQAAIVKAPFAATIQVPRRAVPPAITQPKVQAVLAAWQAQTDKPLNLHANAQTIPIPVATVRSWAIISTNQRQDQVFITYDQVAIKAWLNAYTASVAVAPKPAVQYVQDDVVVNTTSGSNGATLDFDSSAAGIIAAFKAPARSADIQVVPVAFTTQQVRSYSATSKGLQTLINDWSTAHKGMTAGVSFQEIGGQARSAALNDTKQFYAASIYKLFVVDYAYHLIETNQLSPSSLVLGAGKSVDACLEATIVVSDNTCPQALGDQLGWINIDAYAKQQGFAATSLVDHSWSTDTRDVASYLGKLNAGSLINATDTATLLDKMQRQVYRGGIPAGSAGSTVADKVGFYGSYWHDAAIVHGTKASYVLVVFTSGAGPSVIKDLAAQIQQTLNQ